MSSNPNLAAYPEIAELQAACLDMAVNPPSLDGEPDYYLGQFAVATYVALEAAPESVQAVLAKAIRARRKSSPFPPAYALHHLQRHMQQRPLYDEPSNPAPYPYEQHVHWAELVHETLNNPTALDDLYFSILAFRVGSDIARRIRGTKLVMGMYFPDSMIGAQEPLRVLNIGSARDHNLAVLIDPETPLDGIEVEYGSATEPERLAATLSPAAARYLHQGVNQLLAREVELGLSVGIDLWPITDERWGKFIGACRYPSEATPEKWQEYTRLEAVRDSNTDIIQHVTADFRAIGDPPEFINGWREHIDKDDPSDRYDLAVFSTSLYLNDERGRERMFDNALPLLKPGGLIIVQDFGELRPLSQGYGHPLEQFNFIGPNPKPNTYCTLVFDPTQPEKGLQAIATWTDGRCTEMQPGSALLDHFRLTEDPSTSSTS